MRIEFPPEAVEELVQAVMARVLASIDKPDRPEFVTPKVAARYLSCRPQRIYDLISAGKLSRYAEGSRTLLRRDEVLGLITCERRRR